MFRHALDVPGDRVLSASGPDVSVSSSLTERPVAVLGRSDRSDVVLSDRTVSLRHLYVQPYAGLTYACDLFSANGTKVGGKPFESGWVHGPTLEVGPYEIGVPPQDSEELPLPPDRYKPRKMQDAFYGELPTVSLELIGHAKKAVWPINRVITLLGRDDRCRITCGHASVSAVHAAFVLTKAGLWVVDLASRTGVVVGGKGRQMALLSDGVEVRIGRYRLRSHVESMPAAADGDRSTAQRDMGDPAAVGAAAVGAAAVGAGGVGAGGARADAGAAAGGVVNVPFLTKNHQIFAVETDGDSVVVVPRGDHTKFAYRDVQSEANTVVHAITQGGFRHVVVDFSRVPIVGSIIIESIAGFCRAAPGKAVLCSATADMYRVLDEMKLTQVWLHYASREDALAAARFEG